MALAERQSPLSMTEPGWYPDPDETHQFRYFNGTTWTSHVTHFGPTPCDGCFLPSID